MRQLSADEHTHPREKLSVGMGSDILSAGDGLANLVAGSRIGYRAGLTLKEDVV